MNEHRNPNYGLIYYSAYPGQQPLSASNTQVISSLFTLDSVDKYTIQIYSDGGAVFDAMIQLTAMPPVIRLNDGAAPLPPIIRDDSFNSPHWNSINTQNFASGTAKSNISSIGGYASAYLRIACKYTSGGSANIFVLVKDLKYI